jgi:hypothetical protein
MLRDLAQRGKTPSRVAHLLSLLSVSEPSKNRRIPPFPAARSETDGQKKMLKMLMVMSNIIFAKEDAHRLCAPYG